jgi:hypothetical protein
MRTSAISMSMRGARKSDRRSQCRVHRERTAWLGMKDSNSEMSSQITPLKIAAIPGSCRILATETIRI